MNEGHEAPGGGMLVIDLRFRLLGPMEVTRDHTALSLPGTAERALELVGVYKFPLENRFPIYGLAGVARVEAEATVPFLGSVSDTDTDLTFGFGVQYDFTPKLGARCGFRATTQAQARFIPMLTAYRQCVSSPVEVLI